MWLRWLSMIWITEYVPYVGRYRLPIFALNLYEFDWANDLANDLRGCRRSGHQQFSLARATRKETGTMPSSSPRNRFARATRSHRSAFAQNYKPLHMSVILSKAKNLWSSLELISSRQLEMSRFGST